MRYAGPPLLLVHGAWHGAWCWAPLQQRLDARGIRSLAIDLPGHGTQRRPAWLVQWKHYIEAVVTAAASFDEPPIMIGHSMGGGVITAAREAAPGRFAALVYVAAFVPRHGESILGLARRDPPLPGARLRPLRGDIVFTPPAATELFFHDCPQGDRWAGLIQPQPIRPMLARLRETADRRRHAPQYYIGCRHDRAIPPASQRAMADATPMRRIYDMECGHSPFLAAPDRLAEILAEIHDEIGGAMPRTSS